MPRAIDGIKICSKCKESKSVSEFRGDLRNSDGLESWCKDCQRVARRLSDRKRRGYQGVERNNDERPYKYRVIDEHTAAIPVKHKDTWHEAIVDLHNAEWLSEYKWCLSSAGYAVRFPPSGIVSMHRMVLGLERGNVLVSDHINRIRLDNRECNLRAVTQAMNNQNRSPRKKRNLYLEEGL